MITYQTQHMRHLSSAPLPTGTDEYPGDGVFYTGLTVLVLINNRQDDDGLYFLVPSEVKDLRYLFESVPIDNLRGFGVIIEDHDKSAVVTWSNGELMRGG